MSRIKTTEEFIQEARKVHGDKYDYSKVNYINSVTGVVIICPEHGEFKQRPADHLQGHGCPKCSGCAKLSTEEFIEKAKEVHGDKYSYNKSKYVNNKTKITITCPNHGDFLQPPHDHLQGHGCPKCQHERLANEFKKSTEWFINAAREVHGDIYNYDMVNYVNYHTEVTIICPEHGEFKQKPAVHLSGHGCPKCISYKLEKSIEELLLKNDILFETQKSFDWLVSGPNKRHRLKLDVFLPDYNVAIECQGLQHFQIGRGFFGGEDELRRRQELDKLKQDLCTEHGIKVLYYSDLGIDYPYEVFEDLDEILNKIKEYERNN